MRGETACLLSYKVGFSALLALLQELQHRAVSSCLPGCSTLTPSVRAVLVPLTGSVVTLIKLHFCYSSICLLGIWNKTNQRRLHFAITNRSCTKLLATSSFGAQECWELRTLKGCREMNCSSQGRKRLI